MGKAVAVSAGMKQNQMPVGANNSNLANVSLNARTFTNSPVPNSIAKQGGGPGVAPSPTSNQLVGASITNTRTNTSAPNTMAQFNPSTGPMPINSMGNATVSTNMGPGHGMMSNRQTMMNGPFQGNDGMAMGMNMVRNNNSVATSMALQLGNNAMANNAAVNVAQQNMGGMDPAALAKARAAKVSVNFNINNLMHLPSSVLSRVMCVWLEGAAIQKWLFAYVGWQDIR